MLLLFRFFVDGMISQENLWIESLSVETIGFEAITGLPNKAHTKSIKTYKFSLLQCSKTIE